MTGLAHIRFAGLVLACLVAAGCATTQYTEELSDYDDTIEALQQQVARNPNDARPLRDLGVIYLRTNNPGRANEFLQRAYDRDTDDPKTLYHLALANEALGRPETALRLYQQYPDVARNSPYRRLMAGRYAWLVRSELEREVQARVIAEQEARAQGQALCPQAPTTQVVAVYPLVYQGTEAQYAALGRGLAEMITVDLTHVRELQLVERTRLQELLAEIRLAAGPQFDPSTAPRVGCLVGAGRLIGGVYDVLADDLRLDASLYEDEAVAVLDPQTDALRNFFRLEKQIVFALLTEMGIEPTPEERRRIEFIPTQNLQAFLAFSRGLEREDAGAFGEAAAAYRQAAELDPGFGQAQQRATEAEGMARAGGSVREALVAAFEEDLTGEEVGAQALNPVQMRLLMLGSSLGNGFLPGLDQRGADIACVAASCAGLPDPPDPPRGQVDGN